MKERRRSIESLLIEDILTCPVWEFVSNPDASDETWVRPVEEIPAKTLDGRLTATRVRLANGCTAWALIGNIDTTNPRSTQHFMTLRIEREGAWFDRARYFDPDYSERSPAALAAFLGLHVDEVFPISFDVRNCAIGDAASLAGTVQKEPKERLSRADLLKMAVP